MIYIIISPVSTEHIDLAKKIYGLIQHLIYKTVHQFSDPAVDVFTEIVRELISSQYNVDLCIHRKFETLCHS